MNLDIITAEQQEALHATTLGIIGNNATTDYVIANAVGLGFGQIYVFGKGSRKFSDEFFLRLQPHLALHTTEDIALAQSCNLNYIIDCSTKEHIKETNIPTYYIASDERNAKLSIKPQEGTTHTSLGAIVAALAVDRVRKHIVPLTPEDPPRNDDVTLTRNAHTEKVKVLQIGAGGIGTFFGLLAENVDLRVVDFDVYETRNMHRQILCDPGKAKAAVLGTFVRAQYDITRFDAAHIEQLDAEAYRPDVIVGCVDTAASRNCIRTYAEERNIPYHDGGVGAITGQITTMPENVQDKAVVVETSCTKKPNPSFIIPNCIIGAQLANTLAEQKYNYYFDSTAPKQITEVRYG